MPDKDEFANNNVEKMFKDMKNKKDKAKKNNTIQKDTKEDTKSNTKQATRNKEGNDSNFKDNNKKHNTKHNTTHNTLKSLTQKSPQKNRYNVYLEEEVVSDLDFVANKFDTSRSELLNMSAKRFIQHLKENDYL